MDDGWSCSSEQASDFPLFMDSSDFPLFIDSSDFPLFMDLACSRAPDPGRKRVQRPEREEGLEDEEATHARTDRAEAA